MQGVEYVQQLASPCSMMEATIKHQTVAILDKLPPVQSTQSGNMAMIALRLWLSRINFTLIRSQLEVKLVLLASR